MAELWDIAAHVEDHPDDYPQRWRLAKKLYAAHEYRLVLEHLNVLKNEWTPKVNVRRYLAATYYRLGRYREAIAELEDSIAEWPEEIGIREQLAHVLKVDNQLEKALDAWEQVLYIQPDHAIAKKSAMKIKRALNNQEPDDNAETAATDSASMPEDDENIPTPPPMLGMECAQCGAQNSEEFRDCWRCGQPLPRLSDPGIYQDVFEQAERSLPIRSETAFRISVIATLGLLLYALFLGARLLMNYTEAARTLSSLSDIYDLELVPARVAAGLAMMLCWPFMLRLALRICRVTPQPRSLTVYVGGAFLGAFALVMMLMPMPARLLVPATAILLFMALTIVVVGLQLPLGRGLLVWALHFSVVLLIGAGMFWATESFKFGRMLRPTSEVMAAQRFARMPDDHADARPVRLPTALTPIRHKLAWHSSGSVWLDERAAQIAVTVRLEEQVQDMRFQIYDGEALRFHEEIGENRNETFYYAITPNVEYAFVVTGPENVIAQVFIQSLLPFDFVE